MQLSDVKTIKASPETVWAAILNPEVLKLCVPGCESMTGSVEDGFEATVKQKIGPVSASFSGVVKLSDIDPGRAVTITGEGKGGAAGFAKGGAKVRLIGGADVAAHLPGCTAVGARRSGLTMTVMPLGKVVW